LNAADVCSISFIVIMINPHVLRKISNVRNRSEWHGAKCVESEGYRTAVLACGHICLQECHHVEEAKFQ
jgi:hypothetical protein